MCLNNLQATLLPDEALGNMQADNELLLSEGRICRKRQWTKSDLCNIGMM